MQDEEVLISTEGLFWLVASSKFSISQLSWKTDINFKHGPGHNFY